MNQMIKTAAAVAAVVLLGCHNANEKQSANYDVASLREADSRADSAAVTMPSTSLQRMGLTDSVRKFIVTADLKFRVRDVVKATYNIESLVINTGGFVAFTELRSRESSKSLIKVSPDSSVESVHYTVENTMTLRVPKTNLDSFLRGVGALVDYFDYRIIKADDVGLNLLMNDLEQKRLTQYEKRQQKAIDEQGSKLTETATTQENLLNRQLQADETTIGRLKLEDEVKYSTVSLNIYQREAVQHTLVANNKNIKRYQPGFGAKLLNALKYGWGILEELILLLARFWALLLFAAAAVLIYRRLRRYFAKKQGQ